VSRTAFVLFFANAAVIASWLILHAVWFDGAISCNAAVGPDYDQCNDRADLLVALGISAVALLGGTLLTFAAHTAGRLRSARRSSPR
jgi:hypothetical protein